MAKKTNTSARSKPRSTKKQKKQKKEAKVSVSGLDSTLVLLKKAVTFWWEHRRRFLQLSSLYFVTIFILTELSRSVSAQTIIQTVQDNVSEGFKGDVVSSALMVFSEVGALSAVSVYHWLVAVVFSLASIWMIRRLLIGQDFMLRETLYKGMYPAIPFVVVLGLILLQTAPFFVGGLIYSYVTVDGVALRFIEQLPFLILWLLLSTGSGYLISTSVMALYAATLPDMYPLNALRAVRKVVASRRWYILARIIALCLILTVIMTVSILVTIAYASQLTYVSIELLLALLVPFSHVYLFLLYKEIVE